MPPRAITLIFVCDARKLNFIGSKNFLLLSTLNKGDKKINFTPCCSFILISLIECAEPIIVNFFYSYFYYRYFFG